MYRRVSNNELPRSKLRGSSFTTISSFSSEVILTITGLSQVHTYFGAATTVRTLFLQILFPPCSSPLKVLKSGFKIMLEIKSIMKDIYLSLLLAFQHLC